MTAKRLIVNADDFGRTPGVNRGVVEAHARGIVTSASLMVNYPAAADAARLTQQHPELGVGLHLQLTGGGLPALPPDQVPTLLDATGRFHAKPEALATAHPGQILAEARAQLRRFRELVGRRPTHFDSHHHVHKLAAVEQALLTLAWETGLPVRGASSEGRARLRREGLATTDHFVEDFYDAGVSLEGLVALLGRLELGTTELMCHPAVVDAALSTTSSYAEPRGRELEILVHEEVRHTIQASGIKLVTFAVLSA
jgi:predicted glycoside hydrolase/deacetylase ChbG (UPF0249 family)